MAQVPLYSNFQGDFVPVLVLVESDDSMDQVAQKCAYHSVGKRVAAQPDKVIRVRRHRADALFPRHMTVADSGLRATETIDVVFADE